MHTHTLTPKQQRAAVALHAHRTQRAALLAERPTAQLSQTSADAERSRAREAIGAHLARQRAARILDEHRTQRAAKRAAKADAAAMQAGATVEQVAAGRKPNVDALAAKRRDELTRALAYPMTPAEVLAAVRDAVASLRPSDEDDAADVIGQVVAEVIARHGRTPQRADVGREWLRQRAERRLAREQMRRERATGLKASAALHRQWALEDAEQDAPAPDSGPDAVWYAAANRPAPEQQQQPSAQQLAERLQLTPKQTDALARTLDSAQRVTAALTGAERKAAADALRQLRQRFPTADAVRWALRPLLAAERAVDRCKLTLYRFQARPDTGSRAERPAPHRPALALPDVGCCPAAVRCSRGPRWRPVRLPVSHLQAPLTGPGNRGARPHRGAPGISAEHMPAPAPEAQMSAHGWAALIRSADGSRCPLPQRRSPARKVGRND